MNGFLKKTIENALNIKIISVHKINREIYEYKTIGFLNGNEEIYVKILEGEEPLKDEKILNMIKNAIKAFEKEANKDYHQRHWQYIYNSVYEKAMATDKSIYKEVINFTTEKELEEKMLRYIESYIKTKEIMPKFKEVYLHTLENYIPYLKQKHEELLNFIEETEKAEIEYERNKNVK